MGAPRFKSLLFHLLQDAGEAHAPGGLPDHAAGGGGLLAAARCVCACVCVRAPPMVPVCVCVCEGVFVMILFCVSEMCPMEASCDMLEITGVTRCLCYYLCY